MNFKQKLSDENHCYIFRTFFRLRCPWTIHIILTAILLVLAGVQYHKSGDFPTLLPMIAVAYILFTMVIWPEILGRRVMKNIRRSVSYGQELSYSVDQYGIAYTIATGKEFQFHWKDLTKAFQTDRAIFLRFGRATGICFFKQNLGEEKYNRLIKELATYGVKI